MRILIISPLFYPNKTPRAYRAFELSKEFARLGHEVVIFTDKGTYNYAEISDCYRFVVKDIPNLKLYHSSNSHNVNYTIFERVLIKLLKHPLYYPEIELAFRLPKAIRYEHSYDLVISIASPHSSHMGIAYALNSNKNLAKIWIADCGDPFYKNSFSKFPFYFGYLEKWMFKKTDYITIPTSLAKECYPKEARHKIRVIPQGFDFTNIKLSIYEKNACPTFAYAGMLYKDKRDPTQFLEYLVSVKIDFRFIVYTQCYGFFIKYHQQLQEKLIVKDYIERPALIYELSRMDFLVNFENDVTEQVPSKLIDYYLTKRPILSIQPKKLNIDIIEEFLDFNFTNQRCIENIEKFNITIIAKELLALQ